MKIDIVSCLVTMSPGKGCGDHTVVKTGPSSISVAEIPLLEAIHGVPEEDSPPVVSEIAKVGSRETTRKKELARLHMIYNVKVIKSEYPDSSGRSMPEVISDLDLSKSQMAVKAPVKTAKQLAAEEV